MEIFNVMATMSLADMISGPLRNVAGQMSRTGKAATSLSHRAFSLSKSLLPAAMAAGIFFAALAPCVSTAAQFEDAMSKVGAVSRASVSEMAELKGAARELGASTAWSATEVAEGQKYLAMAGFSVRENVAALPAVLDLATAGATDLGRAADISSDILSAFALEAGEMPQVADVLAATFTSSNTSLEMLGETMKYVAPVAQKVGLSLQETAAMAGLLGNVGIKSSQAGTSMRAMLNGLAAPTERASQALQGLGVKTTNIVGDLRNPIAILGDIAKAMEHMSNAQRVAITKDLFGTEAISAALSLFDKAGADGIAKYANAVSRAGTVAEIAARQNDNLAGDTKALGSAFESMKITIGTYFLPVLRFVTQGITGIIRAFDAVASNPLGKFFLVLSAVIAGTILVVAGLSAVVWLGTAAWAAFNAMVLANPLGLIVFAVLAVIGALAWLYNSFECVRDVFDWLAEKWQWLVKFLSVWSNVGLNTALLELWPWLYELFGKIGTLWGDFLSLFDVDLAESGKKLIMTLVQGIKAVLTAPYELVKAGLAKVRDLLPFSDAKEGPLSSLTLSGTKIMQTLGSGIHKAAPHLRDTATQALAGVAMATNLAVTPVPASASIGQVTDNTEVLPVPALAPPESAAPQVSARDERQYITIEQLTVKLDGVQNGEDFVRSLQRFVAQHQAEGGYL